MRLLLILLLCCLLTSPVGAQMVGGDFGMTGIVVPRTGDFRAVERVLPHSPADAAGIKPGDLVLAINDAGTQELKLDDYLARIRGTPGSEVILAVRDRETGVVFSHTLRRVSVQVYYAEHPAQP